MKERNVTGLVVNSTGLHGGIRFPERGVRAFFDDAGVLIQATFEMDDTDRTRGERHRWEYVVPASAILMLISDLGPIAGAS